MKSWKTSTVALILIKVMEQLILEIMNNKKITCSNHMVSARVSHT